MRSALLISDVGKYFCDPQWPHRIVRDEDIPPLEEKAKNIAKFAGQVESIAPLIYTSWVIANSNPEIFNGTQHIVRADPKRDILIEKSAPSSFKNTPLEQKLEQNDIGHLYIVGFETTGCVRATALEAIQKGLKVTVIPDLCADHPDPLYLLEREFIKDDELEATIEQQRTGVAEMKAHGVRFINAATAYQELLAERQISPDSRAAALKVEI